MIGENCIFRFCNVFFNVPYASFFSDNQMYWSTRPSLDRILGSLFLLFTLAVGMTSACDEMGT